MKNSDVLESTRIGGNTGAHAPLGMGTSFYGISDWTAGFLLDTLRFAVEAGITHIDTADGYGNGESEKLIGRFLQEDRSRRDNLFIASKTNIDEMSAVAMLRRVEDSLVRLKTDVIDLYYIHWPRSGHDMRPLMEGLEKARSQGKIRAVGVSNFTVAQMKQLAEVGNIDAHQLGYNLLWRVAEAKILPYCYENKIAVVAYSALAHGILSGNYEKTLTFSPDDQRWNILHFQDKVWASIYDDVQQMKQISASLNYSLPQLALRWLLHQPAVQAVLVSAKSPQQARDNAAALKGTIPESVFSKLTDISDLAVQKLPSESNPFGYNP
ncbi:MAG: aldo/keto reductase [Aggregatilineales bacterium]